MELVNPAWTITTEIPEEENRKRRQPKFTNTEIAFLIYKCEFYKPILSLRIRDQNIFRQKRQIWESIAGELNKLNPRVERTFKEVKLKWKHLTRLLRLADQSINQQNITEKSITPGPIDYPSGFGDQSIHQSNYLGDQATNQSDLGDQVINQSIDQSASCISKNRKRAFDLSIDNAIQESFPNLNEDDDEISGNQNDREEKKWKRLKMRLQVEKLVLEKEKLILEKKKLELEIVRLEKEKEKGGF